jgi:hypothetical protein
MYYIVSNGEDISKLCPILLVFYNNKICFKENILLFGVWLSSLHIFIKLNGNENPAKKLYRVDVGRG